MTTQISGDTGVSQCQPNSVSQDDLQAGVVGKGPIFSAWRNGDQSNLVNLTEVDIIFNAIIIDSEGAFNVSNGRYTAKVAGWYHVSWATSISGVPQAIGNGVLTSLYKNGAAYCAGTNNKPANSLFANPGGSALVYLNGTTDYITVNAYADTGGSTATIVGTQQHSNQFSGFLVRAAP